MSKPTFEIRVSRIREAPPCKLERATDAIDYWKESITAAPWFDPEKEMLVVLLHNTRQTMIAHALVSIGSLNESVAMPREIFRPAVAAGAYGIIMMHNHPSGDPQPSEADRRLTRRIHECGQLLQIPLTDHLIVGGGENPYFSFREAGLL
jgi:DNA repair protein RadC